MADVTRTVDASIPYLPNLVVVVFGWWRLRPAIVKGVMQLVHFSALCFHRRMPRLQQ